MQVQVPLEYSQMTVITLVVALGGVADEAMPSVLDDIIQDLLIACVIDLVVKRRCSGTATGIAQYDFEQVFLFDSESMASTSSSRSSAPSKTFGSGR